MLGCLEDPEDDHEYLKAAESAFFNTCAGWQGTERQGAYLLCIGKNEYILVMVKLRAG